MKSFNELVVEHKTMFLKVTVSIAALVVAYGAGRYTAPTKVKVEEKEVVHEIVTTVQDTSSKEEIKVLLAQIETMKRHTVKTSTSITHPDGTKETKVVVDTHVDTSKNTNIDSDTQKEEAKHTEQKVDVVKEVEKTTITERERPQYFVGPMVVWVPQAPMGAKMNVGAVLGRQLFGPISGSISATVPVSQPISLPTVSGALTVSF